MKTKVQRFLDQVLDVVARKSNATIKHVISDSTDNNRTPSVEQLARYQQLSIFGDNTLASDIRSVKAYLLRNNLLQRVRRNNNRTDAYDVTEFVTAVKRYVLTNETRRKELNQIVSNY